MLVGHLLYDELLQNRDLLSGDGNSMHELHAIVLVGIDFFLIARIVATVLLNPSNSESNGMMAVEIFETLQ
jgi:hypothetical protein